jgi:ElaB/YqjD/DUF883 family membrane-anchored ribosome-binding protein
MLLHLALTRQTLTEDPMPLETNYAPNQNAPGGQSDTSAVGNPGGSIQNAMDASRNRMSQAYSTVQQRSHDALENAEGFIHQRPWQAVIYAASIGAVIGLVAGMMLGGGHHHQDSWHRRWW